MVGAAVVLDPRNGEVLAMVSSPAYNPNVYSKRFTPEVYKKILSNPFKIELNRAIQGLYSPGSVFKIVMAIAGLTDGAIGPETDFNCSGSGHFFGRRFRCWKAAGHGAVDVKRALKVSCDIFFYQTGARSARSRTSIATGNARAWCRRRSGGRRTRSAATRDGIRRKRFRYRSDRDLSSSRRCRSRT